MEWGRRTTHRCNLVMTNLGRGKNKYKKSDATIKTTGRGGKVKGSVWVSCGVRNVAKLRLSIIYASFMDTFLLILGFRGSQLSLIPIHVF